MPGSLWAPFREGNRSEYLAQYFLTALGVSVGIPRPEDIGIDFYCALAQQVGQRLTFHSPFAVQVGSYGTKDFSYGGFTKDGHWQKEQLDWLFSQELPLFVSTVDKTDLSFRLYSTSPIWRTRYAYGIVSEVRLLPGGAQDNSTEFKEIVPSYSGKGGDGCCYTIPLGPPIVELRIDQLQSDLVDKARIALAKSSHLEMVNLTYRRLNVHFVQWPLDILPNDDSSTSKIGQFYAWNTGPGKNTTEQLKALLPIVVALAHNLKAQNRINELNHLKGIFQIIPKEDIPDIVRKNIPEIFVDE